MAEEEGVSTELQRLIDALVVAEWKRPLVKPVITPEEIAEGLARDVTAEELVSESR